MCGWPGMGQDYCSLTSLLLMVATGVQWGKFGVVHRLGMGWEWGHQGLGAFGNAGLGQCGNLGWFFVGT